METIIGYYGMSDTPNIFAESSSYGTSIGFDLYERLKKVSEDITDYQKFHPHTPGLIRQYKIEVPLNTMTPYPSDNSLELKVFLLLHIDKIEEIHNNSNNIDFNMSFEDIWR